MTRPPYETIPKVADFKELLELACVNDPLKPAFTYANGAVSFAKFRQDVLNQATTLAKKYRGSRIALIGENSIEWLILFFGIVLSGNIAVVIDKDETPEKIAAMLKTADVADIFCSEQYAKKLKTGLQAILDKKVYKKLQLSTFSKVLATKPVQQSLPSVSPDDGSVIFFTSGTTGANKAVLLSQKNICADVYGASSLYRPHGNTVAFLPFHHAFGLVTGILMPFYYGCTTYLTSSLKNVAKDIKNNSPETVFVVPAVLELFYRQIWREARKSHRAKLLKYSVKLNESLKKHGLDLAPQLFKTVHAAFGGELKIVICGGAYLDPKYIKWFDAIGITVLNGCGVTECSPVVSVNRVNYSKDGSVGQICRGVEVKIAEDGEILIKGDNVMKGYYGDKKSTRLVLKHGWFYSGDLGRLDQDGFLFITGRKKDLIILSNGENISPESIEAEFLHDPAVRECVVYDEADRIVAEIYPTEDFMGDQAYFDKLVYNYNKDKSRNHQVAFVRLRNEEFAKNNNTKILRAAVKGSHEESQH